MIYACWEKTTSTEQDKRKGFAGFAEIHNEKGTEDHTTSWLVNFIWGDSAVMDHKFELCYNQLILQKIQLLQYMKLKNML